MSGRSKRDRTKVDRGSVDRKKAGRATPAPAAGTPPGARAPRDERRAATHARAIDAQPSVAALVRGSTIATGVFAVAAAASALKPTWFVALGVAVSVALFFAGCAAFIVGYARAVPRSRIDELDLPGLFFLAGSVERSVQRRLLLLLAVQIVVGLAAAAYRPFTPVAFCTLTPVFGLGVLGLCGATHGRFPPRRR